MNVHKCDTRLYRDASNPLISGVCSGIAKRFNLDAIWVRAAAVALFLFAPTAIALGYVLGILFLRKRYA
ncbi:PspC domain-containing protein [Alteromonas sp. LMIT006]|jgi:phage shock protein PspC (stress-responsive transcriptional regulator)|uniref:PspC domain-containing protein n=1 Tax=Alteromonadaceae TaxID=72275 RepID=UPI0019DE139E|nr:PspC domain-containing protein [Alteromonas sp. LMIT006]MBE1287181.1 PspC domain-containing protein [Alteromonadaceae bacterium]UTP72803.1 PspC domain-containing protein [Alteromonas sp. LMIT006]